MDAGIYLARQTMRKPLNHIAAFSILELAIVLSLTGLFISLFFLSVNSFNKTMSQEITIKGELNNFFQFRSNFWLDMEKADSFQLSKNQLTCFHASVPIVYSITDEKLSRHHKDHHTLFEVSALSIEKTNLNNHELVEFKLEWKNTPFSLKYPLQKQNSNYINTYFSKKLWME